MRQPEPSVPIKPRAASFPNVPDIVFDEVAYSYEPSTMLPVLSDCTFKVPKGKVTLVLGPSGCGKTTLARLLLGFLKPTIGQISIDEHDARGMTPHELRGLMSYVSQGDYIVDDTIRENLSWADPVPADEQQVEALVALKIVERDKALSLLDQPARSLSIGQQQRLSLCRILLDTAPVLVMDEPMAGIDIFTLQDILPVIGQALKNGRRTVLLISHKILFLPYAANVVVMSQNGTIIEHGTPGRLLADPDSYLSRLRRIAIQEVNVDNAST
jgi:ABC-type bacteriocin/lantibiotic exporter with double-glycine peptidase domain